jgi:hypothetical protein
MTFCHAPWFAGRARRSRRAPGVRYLYHFFRTLKFACDLDCTGVAARACLVTGDLELEEPAGVARLARTARRIYRSAATRDVGARENASHDSLYTFRTARQIHFRSPLLTTGFALRALLPRPTEPLAPPYRADWAEALVRALVGMSVRPPED